MCLLMRFKRLLNFRAKIEINCTFFLLNKYVVLFFFCLLLKSLFKKVYLFEIIRKYFIFDLKIVAHVLAIIVSYLTVVFLLLDIFLIKRVTVKKRTIQEANRTVQKTNHIVHKANRTFHKANRALQNAYRTDPCNWCSSTLQGL